MSNADFSPSELLIMGFWDTAKSLSRETIATIEREKFTQFILFGHNYESPAQLIALTDHIQSLNSSSLPLLISADQEGGKVQRFKTGFSLLPSAKQVGDKNSPNLTFELSKIQARELFAAGIQLNYAPVADINTNPANPVIGTRAYGDQEEIVSKMVTAVVRGHLQEGVDPCVKHFPGHGDTHLDSHLALPTVNTPLNILRSREWIPFHRAMKSGCRFLMSAHILLPHLDPQFPGTFSKTFLQTHLRDELQFQGVIISDDMEMGAIVDNYGPTEAPILALEAGCDLLCYRHEEQTLIALEAIKKALKDRRLDSQKVKASVDRVRAARKKISLAKDTLSLQDRLARIGTEEYSATLKQF